MAGLKVFPCFHDMVLLSVKSTALLPAALPKRDGQKWDIGRTDNKRRAAPQRLRYCPDGRHIMDSCSLVVFAHLPVSHRNLLVMLHTIHDFLTKINPFFKKSASALPHTAPGRGCYKSRFPKRSLIFLHHPQVPQPPEMTAVPAAEQF